MKRPEAQPTPVPVAPASLDEQNPYLQARLKAAADPHVAGLLQKVHAETPGAEAYKAAAHAYNKALFQKIRQLAPDLKALDAREAAYGRRIDAGKPLAD